MGNGIVDGSIDLMLQTEKYQCKVAEAVADGIVTYLKKQKENENN